MVYLYFRVKLFDNTKTSRDMSQKKVSRNLQEVTTFILCKIDTSSHVWKLAQMEAYTMPVKKCTLLFGNFHLHKLFLQKRRHAKLKK